MRFPSLFRARKRHPSEKWRQAPVWNVIRHLYWRSLDSWAICYRDSRDGTITGDVEKATLVTSQARGTANRHKVVLDIDYPAHLVPSSTKGHFHLYLDGPTLSEHDYMALLNVLGTYGVIEKSYAEASQHRGFSAVRMPWITKADA